MQLHLISMHGASWTTAESDDPLQLLLSLWSCRIVYPMFPSQLNMGRTREGRELYSATLPPARSKCNFKTIELLIVFMRNCLMLRFSLSTAGCLRWMRWLFKAMREKKRRGRCIHVCVSLVCYALEPDLKWPCPQYRDAKMRTVFGENNRAEYFSACIVGWGNVDLLSWQFIFNSFRDYAVPTWKTKRLPLCMWQEKDETHLAPIVLNQFVPVSPTVIGRLQLSFVVVAKLSISKVLLIGRTIVELNCVKTTIGRS